MTFLDFCYFALPFTFGLLLLLILKVCLKEGKLMDIYRYSYCRKEWYKKEVCCKKYKLRKYIPIFSVLYNTYQLPHGGCGFYILKFLENNKVKIRSCVSGDIYITKRTLLQELNVFEDGQMCRYKWEKGTEYGI